MQYTRAQIAFSIAFAAALLTQHFFWPGAFLVVVGAAFIGVGIVGLVRGKIDVKGRSGPTHSYTGLSAYIHSSLFFAFGLLAVWAHFAKVA